LVKCAFCKISTPSNLIRSAVAGHTDVQNDGCNGGGKTRILQDIDDPENPRSSAAGHTDVPKMSAIW